MSLEATEVQLHTVDGHSLAADASLLAGSCVFACALSECTQEGSTSQCLQVEESGVAWAATLSHLARHHAGMQEWSLQELELILPVLHKYDFKDALGASLKWLIEGQQLSCDASAEAWVLRWLHTADQLQLPQLSAHCLTMVRDAVAQGQDWVNLGRPAADTQVLSTQGLESRAPCAHALSTALGSRGAVLESGHRTIDQPASSFAQAPALSPEDLSTSRDSYHQASPASPPAEPCTPSPAPVEPFEPAPAARNASRIPPPPPVPNHASTDPCSAFASLHPRAPAPAGAPTAPIHPLLSVCPFLSQECLLQLLLAICEGQSARQRAQQARAARALWYRCNRCAAQVSLVNPWQRLCTLQQQEQRPPEQGPESSSLQAALTSSPALLPPMTLHEMSGCFQACPPKAEILTGEALRLVQQQPHRLFVRSVLDCSFCGGKQCLVRELRPRF